MKKCDNCKLKLSDDEWYEFCTKHLVRTHIECNASRTSKHKNCKVIDKNRPEWVYIYHEERLKQSCKDARRGSRPAGEIVFSDKFKAYAKFLGVDKE